MEPWQVAITNHFYQVGYSHRVNQSESLSYSKIKRENHSSNLILAYRRITCHVPMSHLILFLFKITVQQPEILLQGVPSRPSSYYLNGALTLKLLERGLEGPYCLNSMERPIRTKGMERHLF